MTRKYCFVSHCGNIHAGEKIFCVYIGDSPRELKTLKRIDDYAVSHDAYFRLWDGDTDFELRERTRDLVLGCERFRPAFERIDLDAKTFCEHLFDGSLDMVENPSYVQKNLFRMSCLLSPSYYYEHSREARTTPALTAKSKNLSHGNSADKYSTAIAVGLILALFLFVGWLDGIEPLVLGY